VFRAAGFVGSRAVQDDASVYLDAFGHDSLVLHEFANLGYGQFGSIARFEESRIAAASVGIGSVCMPRMTLAEFKAAWQRDLDRQGCKTFYPHGLTAFLVD
jgi:hypothetical protein